jgi:hypothetical protein
VATALLLVLILHCRRHCAAPGLRGDNRDSMKDQSYLAWALWAECESLGKAPLYDLLRLVASGRGSPSRKDTNRDRGLVPSHLSLRGRPRPRHGPSMGRATESGVLRSLNDKIYYPPPSSLEIKIDLSFWTRNNIGSVKRGTGLAEYIP